jgi:hypothetical protein
VPSSFGWNLIISERDEIGCHNLSHNVVKTLHGDVVGYMSLIEYSEQSCSVRFRVQKK